MDPPLLIKACNLGAPNHVVKAIIQLESQGLPYALGVNVPKGHVTPAVVQPESLSEALVTAVDLVARATVLMWV